MARILCFVTVALIGPALPGCAQYIGDYQFAPRPMLAQVPATQPGQTPPLTALASVLGVRRTDQEQGIPESVHVRLRLENDGPGPVNFNPLTLGLTNGVLYRFPTPLTAPAQPVSLGPGQAAVFDAYFPFLAGQSYRNTDLESLQLRWQVQIAGQVVGQVVSFARVHGRYYDPYWDGYAGYPYPYYGGSVVVIHRRY
jgi:hypothetical protein